jgi:hypothetical protein
MLYKNISSGAIKLNHYFCVHHSQLTTMHRIVYHNNPLCGIESFDHCVEMDDREARLIAAINNKLWLICPGMKTIKQVELWKKWGPLIPKDEHNTLCAKPPDDVITCLMKHSLNNKNQTIIIIPPPGGGP